MSKIKQIAIDEVVVIGDKTITIKKLSLRKTLRLFDKIGNLPPEITALAGQDSNLIVAQLPSVIVAILPKLADALAESVTTPEMPVDGEFLLEQCSLEDAFKFVEAFLRVNNVAGIVEQLKKIASVVRNESK